MNERHAGLRLVWSRLKPAGSVILRAPYNDKFIQRIFFMERKIVAVHLAQGILMGTCKEAKVTTVLSYEAPIDELS